MAQRTTTECALAVANSPGTGDDVDFVALVPVEYADCDAVDVRTDQYL